VRTFLAAVVLGLALAGCQLDQPTIGGTVVAVAEAAGGEDLQESPTYYEPPMVPEVAWKVEVRLDDGSEVTVTTHPEGRYTYTMDMQRSARLRV